MDFYLEFCNNSEYIYCFIENDFFVSDSDDKFSVYAKITDSDAKEIGYLSGYLFDYDRDFYDNCDDISSDCEKVASFIVEKDSAIKKYFSKHKKNKIFIFDRIEIDYEHRKKGIGSSIIRMLPTLLKNEFGTDFLITLIACDYEAKKKFGFDSVECKNGTNKLIDFYKRFGYKILKDDVMIWGEKYEN